MNAHYTHCKAALPGRCMPRRMLARHPRIIAPRPRLRAGDFEGAYKYFSALVREPKLQWMLHKLAICCEKLGRREEALAALDTAEAAERAHISRQELAGAMLSDLCAAGSKTPTICMMPITARRCSSCFERCRRELPIGYAGFPSSVAARMVHRKPAIQACV